MHASHWHLSVSAGACGRREEGMRDERGDTVEETENVTYPDFKESPLCSASVQIYMVSFGPAIF